MCLPDEKSVKHEQLLYLGTKKYCGLEFGHVTFVCVQRHSQTDKTPLNKLKSSCQMVLFCGGVVPRAVYNIRSRHKEPCSKLSLTSLIGVLSTQKAANTNTKCSFLTVFTHSGIINSPSGTISFLEFFIIYLLFLNCFLFLV